MSQYHFWTPLDSGCLGLPDDDLSHFFANSDYLFRGNRLFLNFSLSLGHLLRLVDHRLGLLLRHFNNIFGFHIRLLDLCFLNLKVWHTRVLLLLNLR